MKAVTVVLLAVVCAVSLHVLSVSNGYTQTKEEAKIPKEYEPLIGTWDAFGNMQEFQVEYTLTFSMKKDTLIGAWLSEYINSDLKKIKFEKNKLSAIVEMYFGEQYFSMNITATLKDNKLTGTIGSEMGEMPFTATKRKIKKGQLR